MSRIVDRARPDPAQEAADDLPASRVGPARHQISPADLPLAEARWKKRYAIGVALSDLVVLTLATALAVVLRFGLDSHVTTGGPFELGYTGLGVLIALAWWGSLSVFRSRDLRIIGEGAEEYRRIIRITFLLFGCLAIASLMLKVDMSRGYLATAFPLGLLLLLANRKVWRVRLQRTRCQGRNISRVLVVGGIRSAMHMSRVLDNNPSAGRRVSGVWVPDRDADFNEWLDVPGRFIPVLGTAATLADALTISGAETVMVTDTEHLGAEGLRELTWQLEGVNVELMVAPNVMDISGSRIRMTAVASMPLIHLEEPQYAEAGAWPKTLFDRTAALALLILFAPLMIAAAVAVKLTSAGPVFYSHVRVGLRGERFRMIKFRSMRTGSDAELAQLLAKQGTGATPLFKIADDPRITSVGKVLRRYSIDELPQLLNVLKGDMSLVGPRPQQPAEVELYDSFAHRRLTVRPGMTGLWQVSGRSDLSWEESIRLDTNYVENWSMTGDMMILWRTVRAVLGSDGAY